MNLSTSQGKWERKWSPGSNVTPPGDRNPSKSSSNSSKNALSSEKQCSWDANSSSGTASISLESRREQKCKILNEDDWIEFHGRCKELTSEAEKRRVLVTDWMGADVKVFTDDCPSLWHDQFPLTVYIAEHFGNVLPGPIASDVTATSARLTVEEMRKKFAGVSQCKVEIQFDDIWPGIINTTLWSIGIENDIDARLTMATDRTGVILGDLTSIGSMPTQDCFPLKIHYKIARRVQTNAKAALLEAPAKREGTVDIQFHTMLSMVVQAKLWQMGCVADDDSIRSSNALLTDATGVGLSLSGTVPDARRFPLKLHFETDAFEFRGIDSNGGNFDGSKARRRIESGEVVPLRQKFQSKARMLKRSTSSFAGMILGKVATPQRCTKMEK